MTVLVSLRANFFFFVSSYGRTYTTVTVESPGSPVLQVPVGVEVVVVFDAGVELAAGVVEDEALLTVELGGGTYTPASCTANTHSMVPLSPVAGPLAVTSSLRMPLADAV